MRIPNGEGIFKGYPPKIVPIWIGNKKHITGGWKFLIPFIFFHPLAFFNLNIKNPHILFNGNLPKQGISIPPSKPVTNTTNNYITNKYSSPSNYYITKINTTELVISNETLSSIGENVTHIKDRILQLENQLSQMKNNTNKIVTKETTSGFEMILLVISIVIIVLILWRWKP
jgi:hypothetical protein